MTINTKAEEYAFLSDMAYKNWALNQQTKPNDSPSKDIYEVIQIIDSISGYYGVVFQNTRANEIIVAHRGTQAPGDLTRDLFITDAHGHTAH